MTERTNVYVHLYSCNNGIFSLVQITKPKRKNSYYREENRVYSLDAGLSDSNQVPTVNLALAAVSREVFQAV